MVTEAISQVPRPYYLLLVNLFFTQLVLFALAGCDRKAMYIKTNPNLFQSCYCLYKIVSCWIGVISIFQSSSVDTTGADGWFEYNVKAYALAYSPVSRSLVVDDG